MSLALARSLAGVQGRPTFPFLPLSPCIIPCLYASSSTQTARNGCNNTPIERVQKGKYCSRVPCFEFKICLQCSDSVRGKKSREVLPCMHAASTMLYRCMGDFTTPGTVREGMLLCCSMPRSCQKCRINSSDGIILQYPAQ